MEGFNTIADDVFIDEIEEVGPSENVVELEPCNIQCNEGGEVANARKQRRMTSVVWGYFEMLPKPKDDPRYKFAFVEWCYRKLYEGDYEQEVMKDFQSFHSEIGMPQKSEIELYLDEPNLDAEIDLDILQFWKGIQYRFPAISAMARDVLCIPISTVASESSFNYSGRILDQYRSFLKHDIVEALVCSKDWLYAEQVDHDTELDAVTDDILDLHITQTDAEMTKSSIIR
ncbi:hypothetical protein KFK09_000204 [Dendrobium nobile]|uniref:HAT C-terminal dimerisation domain-containing protein n=1 Tax=Dendrobium nobile TaxID=94219 RepID=A0A8T3CCH0_DENNO|nr:hypothetical protein KFK09_000204 [Dendrobium nobile]